MPKAQPATSDRGFRKSIDGKRLELNLAAKTLVQRLHHQVAHVRRLPRHDGHHDEGTGEEHKTTQNEQRETSSYSHLNCLIMKRAESVGAAPLQRGGCKRLNCATDATTPL